WIGGHAAARRGRIRQDERRDRGQVAGRLLIVEGERRPVAVDGGGAALTLALSRRERGDGPRADRHLAEGQARGLECECAARPGGGAGVRRSVAVVVELDLQKVA